VLSSVTRSWDKIQRLNFHESFDYDWGQLLIN
jgi:hypothetical protein